MKSENILDYVKEKLKKELNVAPDYSVGVPYSKNLREEKYEVIPRITILEKEYLINFPRVNRF
jgi:hypothetical protein